MKTRDFVKPKFDAWRFTVLYVLIAAVFGFYGLKLFTLQVAEGANYKTAADDNRTKVINVPAQRGIIYDRNGYVLARNAPSYNVAITPAFLPGETDSDQQVFRKLSELIDIPVSNGEINDESVRAFSPCQTDLGIEQVVMIGDTNAPYSPVNIKCNIDEKLAMIIREKSADLPGVSIIVEPVREYPTGELTSTIVGFLGPITAENKEEYVTKGFQLGRDKVGFAGIELSMQDELGGTNGVRTVERDVAGKEIRDLEAPVPAIPGYNVRITLDTRLQSAAKASIVGTLDYWNARLGTVKANSGVVVAMNPKTGEILAMISYPSYENNRMTKIIPAYYLYQLTIDRSRPLLNHAISAKHPPGSVYKLAAAIGALNEGVVTPDHEVEDPGQITVCEKYSENDTCKPRNYVCYDRNGHGMISFLRGLALSCDVYFYKIGGGFEDEVPVGLGILRMNEYARALGYGQKSGIELPGEEDGLVPDPTWKRINQAENWSTGDTYIATIGQGYVLSTPLQVLASIATLANDGKYMKPTIIREITDADGNVVVPFTPKQLWDITKDPLITVFDQNNLPTDEKKTVAPWVIELAKEGMRMVVTEGTAEDQFKDYPEMRAAGKTGTAEYCDDVAQARHLCQPENWPSHAWYVGYAPYDDPEIAVVAFVYNGGEGASVAAPIVRDVMAAYFELKKIDIENGLVQP